MSLVSPSKAEDLKRINCQIVLKVLNPFARHPAIAERTSKRYDGLEDNYVLSDHCPTKYHSEDKNFQYVHNGEVKWILMAALLETTSALLASSVVLERVFHGQICLFICYTHKKALWSRVRTSYCYLILMELRDDPFQESAY